LVILVEPLLVVRRALREQIVILHRRLLAIVRDDEEGRPLDCSTSSSDPMMEGPWCRSEEKREPVSDIDIAVADSLKVLDLKRPIREATELAALQYVAMGRVHAQSVLHGVFGAYAT
jgi:hypothetical protein